MSEAKIFIRPGGYPAAVCPACGQSIDVMTREDDPRWRYRIHNSRGAHWVTRGACPMSHELVNTEQEEYVA